MHPMPVAQGQVGEDEQQLRGDHRLDQAEVAEVEGGQLEQEAGDHAEDAEEPDGSTQEEEQQPPAERDLPRRRSGRDPLGHRRRGREQARHQGQQDLDAHGLGFPSPAPGPWRNSPSARADSVYRNYWQPARVGAHSRPPVYVPPGGSVGKRTQNRAPLPSGLPFPFGSTPTVPPCARAMAATMASPRPAPPVARARELSAR